MLFIQNQMRWAGHLTGIDVRLPKQLFYRTLQSVKRPKNKPKKSFKNMVKNN